LKKKIFFSNAWGINVQNEDIRCLIRKKGGNLKPIVDGGHMVTFFLQTLAQKTPVSQILVDNQNPATHPHSFSKALPDDFSGRGRLTFLLMSVFEDDGVNNFTAENAPPSEKFLAVAVEFFVIHDPTTFLTFHSTHSFIRI
jgi:hypothetical protein